MIKLRICLVLYPIRFIHVNGTKGHAIFGLVIIDNSFHSDTITKNLRSRIGVDMV